MIKQINNHYTFSIFPRLLNIPSFVLNHIMFILIILIIRACLTMICSLQRCSKYNPINSNYILSVFYPHLAKDKRCAIYHKCELNHKKKIGGMQIEFATNHKRLELQIHSTRHIYLLKLPKIKARHPI